jgi:hypothetical protein
MAQCRGSFLTSIFDCTLTLQRRLTTGCSDEATESRLRAHFRQPWRSFPALRRLAFRERFDFPLPKLAQQDDDLVGIAEAFPPFIHLALSDLDDVVLNPVDVRFVLTKRVILDMRALTQLTTHWWVVNFLPPAFFADQYTRSVQSIVRQKLWS